MVFFTYTIGGKVSDRYKVKIIFQAPSWIPGTVEREIAGADINCWLSDQITVADFMFYSADKLIVPGFMNVDIIDPDGFLADIIFKGKTISLNNPPDPLSPIIDRTEIVMFEDGAERYRANLMLEQTEHTESESVVSIAAAPRTDYLKFMDMRNISFPDLTLPGILHSIFTYSDEHVNPVCPRLKKSDIFIRHNMKVVPVSYKGTANTLIENHYENQNLDKLKFNPLFFCHNLGSYSVYDFLSSLCFSFYSVLYVTNGKIIFTSIFNKQTDNIVDLGNRVDDMHFTSQYQKLYYAQVKESNDNAFLLGSYSEVYPGIDKKIPLANVGYLWFVNQNAPWPCDCYGFWGTSTGGGPLVEQSLLFVDIYSSDLAVTALSFVDDVLFSDPQRLGKLVAEAWYRFRAVNSANSTFVEFEIPMTGYSIFDTFKRGTSLYSPVSMKEIVDELGGDTEITAVYIGEV